jgi:hypothetical protein
MTPRSSFRTKHQVAISLQRVSIQSGTVAFKSMSCLNFLGYPKEQNLHPPLYLDP